MRKKKLILKMIQLLPANLRHPLLRLNLKLPEDSESEFEFKFITTDDEFFESISLLHNCYVNAQFMRPDPDGIRLTPYHLLQDTLTVVAKYNNKVVATMSLVRDNRLGLPMEKIFDLSSLRQEQKTLCEVSALAIHPDHRGKQGELLHSLIRYLWKYAYEWYNVDYYVIAVNPSMSDLYEAFYLFSRFEDQKNIVQKYNFVNSAPAVGLCREVINSYQDLEKIYSGRTRSHDLHHFMVSPTFQKQIAPKPYFNISQSIVNQQFIRKLYQQLQCWEQRFSPSELNVISNTHGFKDFQSLLNGTKQRQRFSSNCPLWLPIHDSQSQIQASIKNVSKFGLQLQVPKNIVLKPNSPHILNAQLGNEKKSQLVVENIWQNSSGQIGMRILKSDLEWNSFTEYLDSMGHTHTDANADADTNQTNKMSRAS